MARDDWVRRGISLRMILLVCFMSLGEDTQGREAAEISTCQQYCQNLHQSCMLYSLPDTLGGGEITLFTLIALLRQRYDMSPTASHSLSPYCPCPDNPPAHGEDTEHTELWAEWDSKYLQIPSSNPPFCTHPPPLCVIHLADVAARGHGSRQEWPKPYSTFVIACRGW